MVPIADPTEASDYIIQYSCLTGHEVDLESETVVATLDGGARLRLCREHGSPIAITKYPRMTETSPAGARDR